MTYIYREFPKWKYHRDGRSKIVQNADEEKSLGKGWYNTPAEVARANAPSHIEALLQERVKPIWTKWRWVVAAMEAIFGTIGAAVKIFLTIFH